MICFVEYHWVGYVISRIFLDDLFVEYHWVGYVISRIFLDELFCRISLGGICDQSDILG